jgi:hypothetical protein
MFAAIINSGGSKLIDMATEADPVNESAKAPPADDMNVSTPDLPPVAKEREGSSVPFEREGSITDKERKDWWWTKWGESIERNITQSLMKIKMTQRKATSPRGKGTDQSIQEAIVRMCTNINTRATPRMGNQGIIGASIALLKMS